MFFEANFQRFLKLINIYALVMNMKGTIRNVGITVCLGSPT